MREKEAFVVPTKQIPGYAYMVCVPVALNYISTYAYAYIRPIVAVWSLVKSLSIQKLWKMKKMNWQRLTTVVTVMFASCLITGE